ncbi:MAG: glycoside hydrolase family 13 protein [Lachnospiraceae bacterium]|nr:glycoside hydrolase family 13 protein [Lachnospiraceae bacterium]
MFRTPCEPNVGDRVTVKFRSLAADKLKVYLLLGDEEIKMSYSHREGRFVYHVASFVMPEGMISYDYKITNGEETLYYNKLGWVESRDPYYAFRVTGGFKTPDWAKGAVIYQIFVDRFCNGDKTNDVVNDEYYYINGNSIQIQNWDETPKVFDVRCFYGGDLAGVRSKLDYLQSLGVEVIYFNPLFVSPSNHKYDSQDYDHIDPHYGVIVKDSDVLLRDGDSDNSKAGKYITRTTDIENLEASDRYFADLVEEIHRRGMRVILDGVFNHCGSFNRWLDREGIYENQKGYSKGAYVSSRSPYKNYFSFKEEDWPYNDTYDGWWGHETLPKLNYEDSPELYADILRIAAKWVSPPYNCDGWRLDVAADLGHTPEFNHRFWKDFRNTVKKANPDAIILAEHYGDPSAWLRGDEWDTVMNYDAFMEPITWFLTGLEKHSDEYNAGLLGNGDWFFKNITHNMSKFQQGSLCVAMNELSNHDHSRFLTRTNSTVGRLSNRGPEAAGRGIKYSMLRAAVVFQMTWPGAPTIYYGDETGVVGWTDPDNRRTYPWGHENWELIEFHKYIISMHKKISCLKCGSVKMLIGTDHLIAYGRFDERNQAVVIINNKDEERSLALPVWQLGIPDGEAVLKRIMVTYEHGCNVGRKMFSVSDGYLKITVGPMESQLYVAGDYDYKR